MSAWNPGDGDHDHDTVTFGSQGRPWSSARRRLVIGSVGLAAGLFVALVVADADDIGRQANGEPGATPTPVVVAGSVEMTGYHDERGPEFAVELFNTGDESITVSGLAFDDIHRQLVGIQEETRLPAGVWKSFRFWAPPDCFAGVPDKLTSVRVTRRTGGQDFEEEVALPDHGRTLLDYHELLCAPDVQPRAQDELVGVWVLDEAYPAYDAEGFQLWRFEPDGSFAADNGAGLLRNAARGLKGTYSLRNGGLRIDVEGGFWCTPDERTVWRPSLLQTWKGSSLGDHPVLALKWLDGDCPNDEEGTVWVMRRILDRAG